MATELTLKENAGVLELIAGDLGTVQGVKDIDILPPDQPNYQKVVVTMYVRQDGPIDVDGE